MPGSVWGEMAFDPSTRVIANIKNEKHKYLSKNEFALLQCLMEGPQTKENLIQHIWFEQGLVVTDASYYQLVTQLRNSFDENGLTKRLVRTIPRYGLELVEPEPDTEAPQAQDKPIEEEQGAKVTEERAQTAAVPPAPPPSGPTPWQPFGRRFLQVCFLLLIGVAAGVGMMLGKANASGAAQDKVAWRMVCGVHVSLKNIKWPDDKLNSYIGAVKEQSRLEGAAFDNYYLKQQPGSVEVLACEKDNNECVTYCFY